jgi:hypothetical protein
MKKNTLLILAAVGLPLVVGLLIKQFMFRSGVYVERYTDGRLIPPGGLLLNSNPLTGLANDTEEDFRRLYKGLKDYATQLGKFPEDPRYLVAFTSKWSHAQRVTVDCFGTPDYEKSDDYWEGDAGFNYRWSYMTPRADGSKKSVKDSGPGRDVWVYSEVLVRSRRTVFRDGTLKDSPEGSFVVLWSDGVVENIPLSKRVTVPQGGSGSAFYFAGERGVPPTAAPTGEGNIRKAKWWPAPKEAEKTN